MQKGWSLDKGQTVTGTGILRMFPPWFLAFNPNVTVDITVRWINLHGWAPILQIQTLRPMSYQASASNY